MVRVNISLAAKHPAIGILSIFLACICFLNTDNDAIANDASKKCSQEKIQRIIDDDSATGNRSVREISKCGKLGKIIIDYWRYLDTKKPNANLEGVYNYNLLEIMAKNDVLRHYAVLANLNQKYKFYRNRDYYFNVATLIYTNENYQKFHDNYHRTQYVKVLRYLLPQKQPNIIKKYLNMIGKSKSSVFYRERDYWEKRYFGRRICDAIDPNKQCMNKILAKIGDDDVDVDKLITKTICNVALVHQQKFYIFTVCDSA